MKQIAGYVTDYLRHINRIHFFIISLVVSILIWVNYHYQLNDSFSADTVFIIKFLKYYLLFTFIFITAWLSGFFISGKPLPQSGYFYLLLLTAPAIFSVKVSLQVTTLISLENSYLSTILQWPLKMVTVFLLVCILWSLGKYSKPVAGLNAKGFNARPYLLLLLLMLPLLLIAGHGDDFQRLYPKLQMINEPLNGWQKTLFEICYGLDFFTIELFFRGFLVLAFIKYAGKDAILPMAAFYCTIHFGKPVAECISSYFGGLILGTVVYNTRSIWGGLIVHLGIAWMMEAIGIFF